MKKQYVFFLFSCERTRRRGPGRFCHMQMVPKLVVKNCPAGLRNGYNHPAPRQPPPLPLPTWG